MRPPTDASHPRPRGARRDPDRARTSPGSPRRRTTSSRPSSSTSLVRRAPRSAKRIEAAREEGDLRENGGYHAAKEEQGKQELRVRQLQQLLRARQGRRGAGGRRRRRARHGRDDPLRRRRATPRRFLLASREYAGARTSRRLLARSRRWARRQRQEGRRDARRTSCPTAGRPPSRSSRPTPLQPAAPTPAHGERGPGRAAARAGRVVRPWPGPRAGGQPWPTRYLRTASGAKTTMISDDPDDRDAGPGAASARRRTGQPPGLPNSSRHACDHGAERVPLGDRLQPGRQVVRGHERVRDERHREEPDQPARGGRLGRAHRQADQRADPENA